MFSIRQILLAIAVFSVISLVISLGLAGQGWAVGVTFAILFLITALIVMVLAFLVIEFSSQVRGAMEKPKLDEFSPFRAERPEKMPERPEAPNLEQMIPGWEKEQPASPAEQPPVATQPNPIPQPPERKGANGSE